MAEPWNTPVTNASQALSWLQQFNALGYINLPFLSWVANYQYVALAVARTGIAQMNANGNQSTLVPYFLAPPQVVTAATSLQSQASLMALEQSYCAQSLSYATCDPIKLGEFFPRIPAASNSQDYQNYVTMTQQYLSGQAPSISTAAGNPWLPPNTLNTVAPTQTVVNQAPTTNALNPPNGTQQVPTYQQVVGGQTGGSVAPAFVTEATSWIQNNLGLVAAGIAAVIILPMVMGKK